MAGRVTPEELKALLEGDTPFALLDVREVGEYNSTHIPGSCWLPRRRLEFQLQDGVPFAGVLIVVCDDDGRRAALAADTVERMGYSNVSVLEGGINAVGKRGVADGVGHERAQQGLRRARRDP